MLQRTTNSLVYFLWKSLCCFDLWCRTLSAVGHILLGKIKDQYGGLMKIDEGVSQCFSCFLFQTWSPNAKDQCLWIKLNICMLIICRIYPHFTLVIMIWFNLLFVCPTPMAWWTKEMKQLSHKHPKPTFFKEPFLILKCSLFWTEFKHCRMPNPGVCVNIINARHLKDGNGTITNPQKFLDQDFEQLKQYCMIKRVRYIDDMFPPDVRSIGTELLKPDELKRVVWLRPHVSASAFNFKSHVSLR